MNTRRLATPLAWWVAGCGCGVIASLLLHAASVGAFIMKAPSGVVGRPRPVIWHSDTEALICKRRGRKENPASDCAPVSAAADGTAVGSQPPPRRLPPEIEQELFSRVISFFGEENWPKVQRAFVVVVGLGGVGSHAAHMLARSGVGKIRVIDFDQVTLSSLNRHAVATLADVGLPKCTVLRDRIQAIVPNCDVEPVRALFSAENADELLSGDPTYVLDCIDDVNTKADLLGSCKARGLKVISSLGAGLKADPTRLVIGQLDNTKEEALAIRLRTMLKRKGHSPTEITTVYCLEKPRAELLPLTDEQREQPKVPLTFPHLYRCMLGASCLDAQEFGLLDNFRIRVLPVLGTMPAIFGQAMAAHALCDIAGQPITPAPMEGLSRNVKHKLMQHLQNRERNHYNNTNLDILPAEIEEAVQDVWGGRCVATGARFGTGRLFCLTRWDRSRPPDVSNLILLQTLELADRFDKEGPSIFDEQTRRKIEERLKLFD